MLLASSVSCLFKWRQFEPEVILLAVGWYLRFSLSYRDVEELLAERGLHADHVTVWRWVQRYARRWNYVCAVVSNRPATVGGSTRPTSGSRVSGCIYTALVGVDSTAARRVDFLSALARKRSAAAASRLATAKRSRTIRRRGESTPTSTPVIRQPSCNKPRLLWRGTADIDRCSTSTMSLNRITGRSSAGLTPASIFARFGELGVRSPATRRSI